MGPVLAVPVSMAWGWEGRVSQAPAFQVPVPKARKRMGQADIEHSH